MAPRDSHSLLLVAQILVFRKFAFNFLMRDGAPPGVSIS